MVRVRLICQLILATIEDLTPNGNFTSANELNTKIEKHIEFYNVCLIKPLKWKFKGFIKAKQLQNFKLSNN